MLTSELFFIYLSNYLMFMMAYNFFKTLRGYACLQPLKATYAYHFIVNPSKDVTGTLQAACKYMLVYFFSFLPKWQHDTHYSTSYFHLTNTTSFQHHYSVLILPTSQHSIIWMDHHLLNQSSIMSICFQCFATKNNASIKYFISI